MIGNKQPPSCLSPLNESVFDDDVQKLSDYWFTFDENGFAPMEERDVLIADVNDDWDAALSAVGFKKHGSLGGQFDVCEVEIFNGPPSQRWLITVMVAGGGIINAVCDEAPQMLKFIRDYCVPLLALNSAQVSQYFFERAHDVLFDPQRGLQCAQDVAEHENRQREYYARKRNEG